MSSNPGLEILGLPAPILPVGVAVAYIAFVIYTRKHPSGTWIPGGAWNGDKRAPIPRDEENAASENLPPPPRNDRLVTALRLLHQFFTASTLFQRGRQADHSDTKICLVQLALTGAELALRYGRSEPISHDDLFLLGVGWTGLLIQSSWAPPSMEVLHIAISIVIGILGVTAILPSRLPVRRPARPAATAIDAKDSPTNLRVERKEPPKESPLTCSHIISTSLLLTLLIDRQPGLKSWQHQHASWSTSPWLRLSIPLLLMLLRDAITNWRATDSSHETITRHLRAFFVRAYVSAPDHVRDGVVRPLLAVGFVTTMWFTVSFLISCLGFRKLILGRPPTAPSFRDGGMLGAILYLPFVTIKILVKQYNFGGIKIGSFGLAMIFTHALGQMISGALVLAGALYASEILMNDNPLKIKPCA